MERRKCTQPKWPSYDRCTYKDEIEIVIQINGKSKNYDCYRLSKEETEEAMKTERLRTY